MTDEKITKTITSLNDFNEDMNLVAEIETLDGMVYKIPIRKLPLDEWAQVGRDIEDPKPPQIGARADGTILYNDKDETYQRLITEVEDARMYHRILACIRFEVDGKSKAQQVANLRKQLPADVTQALGSYLFNLHNRWRRTVEARAESFHGVRTESDAGAAENGLVDGDVESTGQ